jgi:hypothetical protein
MATKVKLVLSMRESTPAFQPAQSYLFTFYFTNRAMLLLVDANL